MRVCRAGAGGNCARTAPVWRLGDPTLVWQLWAQMMLVSSEEGPMIGDLELARTAAEWIEVLAVIAIVIGVLVAVLVGLTRWIQSDAITAFSLFKRYMARGLLVGLDLLIAADVIKTVTLAATLENATVLAMLVVIRTFLSWTLVLEVEGHWPWQPGGSISKRTPR